MGSLLHRRKAFRGFSPLDVSGLEVWLDASDSSTITESSGAVSQWDDKSGSGNHVTQATSDNQPTTNSLTLNGLNVIDFDGVDDRLINSGFTTSLGNTFTIFTVLAQTGAGTDTYFDGTTVSTRCQLFHSGGNVGIYFGSADILETGGSFSNSAHLYRVVGSSTDEFFRDDVSIASGTLSAADITAIEGYLNTKWGL